MDIEDVKLTDRTLSY